MIKKCAIYTRSAIQDVDISEELKCAEAYLEGQPDTWIPKHYHDNGYSGLNLVRPSIIRLMNDIRDGKIDAVVVTGVDRISRNAADFCEFAAIMNEYNVQLITLRHGTIEASPAGNLLLMMLAAFAQYQDSLEREAA